jgi:hypothetical protein
MWGGRELGRGLGKSKKDAEVEAARVALLSSEFATSLERLTSANYKATKIPVKTCE